MAVRDQSRPRIIVAAAIVERDGRFLLTRRLSGTHLAGFWEFPGGKCEADETPEACLRREIREELDVDVSVGPEVLTTAYDYADRAVELHFFRCGFEGEPSPQLQQEIRWVSRSDLASLELPPADAALVAWLTEGR
jgi:mutator protein MutT